MPPLFRIHTPNTMRAQQRTSQRRRNKPNPGGVQLYTQDWEASQSGTFIVSIGLTMLPNGDPVNREGWVELDPLKWWNRTTAEYPTSAVPTLIGWDLTYPTAIPSPFTIVRMPNDDSLRGPGGIYLTGKAYQQTGFGPSPEDVDIESANISGLDVVITWNVGPTDLYIGEIIGSIELNGDGALTGYGHGNRFITCRWATPPVSGDIIQINAGAGRWLNETGGGVLNKTIPVV